MATSMNDTIAGLRAARSLIEKGWTQHYYARDEQGNGVEPDSGAAVRWCVGGSCLAVSDGSMLRAQPLFRALEAVVNSPNLPGWNDDRRRTWRTAVRLFDRAIARLEAEASS